MKHKNKSLKRRLFELRLKNTILNLLFLVVVFTFAYLFNKWFEAFVYILTYTIIRSEFTKALHGSDFTASSHKGIKYCRYITFIVQIISIIFIITIDISKYVNLLLAFVLGVINFFAKDYLQYKLCKTVFFKGMEYKDIPSDLAGIEYKIIEQYYIKRYKLDKIAINLGYSVDNIKKLKSKIIKRYS